MPETVEIAPALPEDEIEAAIQAAQTPGQSGKWTVTHSGAGSPGICKFFDYTITMTLAFNPDGSLTIDGRTATRTGDNTYTENYTLTSGDRPNDRPNYYRVITFTSPTTFTGQETVTHIEWGCVGIRDISGVWASP